MLRTTHNHSFAPCPQPQMTLYQPKCYRPPFKLFNLTGCVSLPGFLFVFLLCLTLNPAVKWDVLQLPLEQTLHTTQTTWKVMTDGNQKSLKEETFLFGLGKARVRPPNSFYCFWEKQHFCLWFLWEVKHFQWYNWNKNNMEVGDISLTDITILSGLGKLEFIYPAPTPLFASEINSLHIQQFWISLLNH